MGGKHGRSLGNAMGWEQHGNTPGTAWAEHCNFRGVVQEEFGNTSGMSSKYFRNFMAILKEQHRKSMDSPRNIIGVV